MEPIASEAGVTKAVLYDHFSGKEGLRQAVLDDYGEELLTTLGSGVQTDRTPAQLLHDFVTSFAAFAERDTELFRFVTHGEQTLLTESSPVFAALIRNTVDAVDTAPAVEALDQLGALPHPGHHRPTERCLSLRTLPIECLAPPTGRAC